MGRPTGQLGRSLDALTIAISEGRDQRRSSLSAAHSGETTQQVQLPLAGALSDSNWYYIDHDVNWDMPFLYAPLQRAVPFKQPHFHYGFEHVNPPNTLIIAQAHVLDWHVNDSGWTTGAKMRLAVQAPYVTPPPVTPTLVRHPVAKRLPNVKMRYVQRLALLREMVAKQERASAGKVVKKAFRAGDVITGPPGSAAPVNLATYSMLAHLTFQGYAATAEGDEFAS